MVDRREWMTREVQQAKRELEEKDRAKKYLNVIKWKMFKKMKEEAIKQHEDSLVDRRRHLTWVKKALVCHQIRQVYLVFTKKKAEIE